MCSKHGPNEVNGARPQPRRWSISRRLTVLYVGSSLLMVLSASMYLYGSLVGNLEREDNAFLGNKIQDCRRVLRERPEDTRLLANEIQVEAATSQFIKYYVRLLDERGQVVLETPGMTRFLPMAVFPQAIATSGVPARGKMWKSSTRTSYLLMSARAQVNRRAMGWRLLQVALDVSDDEALIAGYRRKSLEVVVLCLLFSAMAGVFIARKGLQSVEEIARVTEHITASQLHERIVANGWPEELASLARSFDRMLDRLEDSFKRLAQFSADLAHELRTPVNNLRGEAGVALSQSRTTEEYRRTLESSLEEYARLARLIDNLLFLARADSPAAEIKRTACDARESIEVVRAFYEALAEERQVQVWCEGQGAIEADPMLLRQAVSNLLSNALNYSQSGGRVLIQARQLADQGLEILVSDTGCGIPAEHVPRIFDRLYRVSPARSQGPNGAGLGLAIVKSIMTLHGGSVEVESEVGKGSRFTLRFPSAQSNV